MRASRSSPVVHLSAPTVGSASATFWGCLAALVVLNLLVRLPLPWELATVRNDGAEYLAIARSLRNTGQYATDLKYHFYNDDPVRHNALPDRPPLYPLFAATCARVLPAADPTTAARLGNILLACGALMVAACYLRRLWGETVALAASGYTFLLPHTVYWTAQPMTEALTLALTFGALLCWSRSHSSHPHRWAALAGLLVGMGYLTRPTGGLVLVVLAVDAWRRGREQAILAPEEEDQLRASPPAPLLQGEGRLLRTAESAEAALSLFPRREGGWGVRPLPLIALLGAFLLCALPYHLALWQTYGSPLHSSLGFTFSIGTYYEIVYHGFERAHVSTLEFLRTRGGEIPGLVLQQAASHLPALTLPLLGLWPFAARLRREDFTGERWSGWALAALTIAVHTAVWSAWGSSRYFLPILPLLAAPLLASVLRCWHKGGGSAQKAQRWWRIAAVALPLASCVGVAVELGRLYETEGQKDHGIPGLPRWKAAAEAVRGLPLVASNRPATLNLLAELPAVMLPFTTDRAQLTRFVTKYQPQALVLFVEEPLRPEAETIAAGWRDSGLPSGWYLATDTGNLLLARPERSRAEK